MTFRDMTSKERMLASLQGQPVDRIPVAPIYLSLFLNQEVRRRALDRYRMLIGDHQRVCLEPWQEVNIRANAIHRAWQSLDPGPDWLCWPRLSPPAGSLEGCFLQQDAGRLWRVCESTGQREDITVLADLHGAEEDLWVKSIPLDQAQVDRLVPFKTADQLLEEGALDVMRQLVEILGDHMFICGAISTPFWESYDLLGFHGLMTMPVDNPDLFHYLQQRLGTTLSAKVKAYARVGVDGLFVEECLTSADMISPRLYDEFVYAYDKLLVDECQSLGLAAILYITGDILPRLPWLVELAPSVLAVEESKKGFRIDLAEIAAAVGSRMALFGNLDSTRVKDWSDAELARCLRDQMRAARPARGFVASVGSPFPLDTPRERVTAFFAVARGLNGQESHSRSG